MKRSILALISTALLSHMALAAETVNPVDAKTDAMKFTFPNEDITKMIEAYSLATGQRFVVDPNVRGRATILAADSVSKAEAFNLLSDALAINGFAIRNDGDTMIVQTARTMARSETEVTTTLPAAKPERMVTYILPLKYITADYVNRTQRFLPSKDGELLPNEKNNSLTIVDWSSNIQRIDQIVKALDKPADAKFEKMAQAEHKQWAKDHPRPEGAPPAAHKPEPAASPAVQ